MRILSPFKDYYDSINTYGIDKEVTLFRKTKVEDQVPSFQFCRSNLQYIGFAGKMYPFFYWRAEEKVNPYTGLNEVVAPARIDYDWEKVLQFRIESNRKKYRRYQEYFQFHYASQDYGIRDVVSGKNPLVQEAFSRFGPIFRVYSTVNNPPVYGHFDTFEINPKLEPLGFAKVLPPHEAYNELYKVHGKS